MRTLLVVAILVFGIGAAFRSRFAALMLYLWYAFFRPEQWLWLDITSLRLSLWLGALLVLPSLLSGVYPNLTHPISIGAVTFLVAGLLGQLNAVNPALGWYWLEYFAKLLLVVLLIIPLVNTRQRLLLALSAVAASFAFHPAKAGLMSLLSGGLRFMEGPGGSFIDNNAYAVGIAMAAPLVACIAQNAKWAPLKWGAVAAIPMMLIAVVSTYSRAGFLAMIVGLVALTFFQRRRTTWLALMVLVAVPTGIFMNNQAGYLDRMETIQTYEQVEDVSALSRIHFWQVAASMAAANPLGIGLFNYESAYDAYDWLHGAFGQRRSVHSSHLQVLAETGILGALAWTGLFAYAFWAAFRARRRARQPGVDPDTARTLLTVGNALIASMAAFLVGGSFIAMALNDMSWVCFGLIAALDRLSAEAVAPVAAPQPTVVAAHHLGAAWAHVQR